MGFDYKRVYFYYHSLIRNMRQGVKFKEFEIEILCKFCRVNLKKN